MSPTTTTATDWVNSEIRGHLARGRRTQQQLAAALGLSGAAVTRRMAGDTHWTLPELERVADFLQVPLLDLLPAEVVA